MALLSNIIGRGLLAARPAAGTAGALYYATDGPALYRDNGSSWDTLTLGGMTNPMTAQDDIIIGGASGTPTRLAKGTDGQVLTVDPTTHHLVWATPSGGGGSLTTTTDTLGSDLSLPAAAWTDVLTRSFAAGTWLLFGKISVLSTASVQFIEARITDGTTHYGGDSIGFAASGYMSPLVVISEPIVLTGATTLKLQAFDQTGQPAATAKASGALAVTKTTWLRGLKVA